MALLNLRGSFWRHVAVTRQQHRRRVQHRPVGHRPLMRARRLVREGDRTLPCLVTLPVDGFGPVVFCHATPRDDEEVVLVDSRLERWAEVLADLPDEVMTVVCGHTHMPFTRLANTRQIINPGSIGMPYGRPGAHWAILHEGAIEMRRTAYDLQAACAQITAASSYPDVAKWADYFLSARATDADALAAFGPRDGRT